MKWSTTLAIHCYCILLSTFTTKPTIPATVVVVEVKTILVVVYIILIPGVKIVKVILVVEVVLFVAAVVPEVILLVVALLLVLLLLSRHVGCLWRIGVREMGREWRTDGHCEILEGMSELVGRGEGLDG